MDGDFGAIPDGYYDVAADTDCVSVGQDRDTSEFAVATVRRWWSSVGQAASRRPIGC